MKKIFLSLLFSLIAISILYAQPFSRADSLRGTLNPMRSCYDVGFYDIALRIDLEKKQITGQNKITFRVTEDFDSLQLDLFENMHIERITHNDKSLQFRREGAAIFVYFDQTLPKQSTQKISVEYSGKPRIALNPPWDGGFTWKKDAKNRDWIGVSCEGIGASLWYPNKDHLSDKPDSMHMRCEVPNPLICVSNGRLRRTEKLADGYTAYHWATTYPINNYNITLNIANYAHFKDHYINNEGDSLDLDYYVLDYNLNKAKKHFTQTHTMLKAYEDLFGKYPFWNDGYALVETPYWGMEHQGAIAYGNNYRNNSWGFDYILIHETGHEYFGNSISANDHAELWIHETFTTYAETLFMEHWKGKATALRYIQTQRSQILNQTPIVGPLGVNYDGWVGSDIYYKGAWVLHTFRHALGDDEQWLALIRNFYQKFKHSNINTQQVIDFFVKESGQDWEGAFQHFLYTTKIPTLEYRLEGDILHYRWKSRIENFALRTYLEDEKSNHIELYATTAWQSQKLDKMPEGNLSIPKNLFWAVAKNIK
ncbi:MAG: M1 family metallopeptidase [Bernardetiaceae bacterium]|nr:M1 family metallopeptidase [Bernardetiaceae bacterium]